MTTKLSAIFVWQVIHYNDKEILQFFTFPLLSIFSEPTQCTAQLCCWVLQHVRSWSYWMSALAVKLACEAPFGFSIATFFAYYAIPFSGWYHNLLYWHN